MWTILYRTTSPTEEGRFGFGEFVIIIVKKPSLICHVPANVFVWPEAIFLKSHDPSGEIVIMVPALALVQLPTICWVGLSSALCSVPVCVLLFEHPIVNAAIKAAAVM
jgi:hypothetical protein